MAEARRLPAEATMTMDLLVAVGNNTEPVSRTHQEALKVFKRMAKLVGIEGTERWMRFGRHTSRRQGRSHRMRRSCRCSQASIQNTDEPGQHGLW